VLAAIQICLGANARRTHRARCLRDLVRRGDHGGSAAAGSSTATAATTAKIRVTLRNGGSDAYQPDVYGASITIERTITVNGSGYNGYKLLDSAGVERSRSKKDLDDMLDTLYVFVCVVFLVLLCWLFTSCDIIYIRV
jgi:structural maintenance of chromosomes protein 6